MFRTLLVELGNPIQNIHSCEMSTEATFLVSHAGLEWGVNKVLDYWKSTVLMVTATVCDGQARLGAQSVLGHLKHHTNR